MRPFIRQATRQDTEKVAEILCEVVRWLDAEKVKPKITRRAQIFNQHATSGSGRPRRGGYSTGFARSPVETLQTKPEDLKVLKNVFILPASRATFGHGQSLPCDSGLDLPNVLRCLIPGAVSEHDRRLECRDHLRE